MNIFTKKDKAEKDEDGFIETFLMNTIGDKAIPYFLKFVNKITPTFSEKGIILCFDTVTRKKEDGTEEKIPILILLNKNMMFGASIGKKPTFANTVANCIIETVDLRDKANFSDFVARAQAGKIEEHKVIDIPK